MARLREQDLPESLNLRFGRRLVYFLELAARLRGVSVRDYIEAATLQSFEDVSLRDPDDREPFTTGHDGRPIAEAIDAEKEKKYALSKQMSALWDDNPYTRLELLYLTKRHLMSAEDQQLWDYLHSRDDLKIRSGKGYKLDRKAIADQWMELKAAAKKGKK